MSDSVVAQNTDKELWRTVEGDYYSKHKLYLTESGGLTLCEVGTCVTLPPEEWFKLATGGKSWNEMLPLQAAQQTQQPDDSPELLALIEQVKWLIDDGVRYQGSFSDMATHSKAQADRARLADYLNGVRLHKRESSQPDELPFNSHTDKRLTKSGGMSFEVWAYILELENKAHGNPTGLTRPIMYADYYGNDYTPHGAIEEDFDNA